MISTRGRALATGQHARDSCAVRGRWRRTGSL